MRKQATRPDWASWMRRWDEQQTCYLPRREERFTAMLDAVRRVLGSGADEGFTAVDLACGPGSLSARLLARFPAARCVAVDLDPVLMTLGRGALGDAGGRLRWVEADLMTARLARELGETRVDAVLSSTALHWLPAGRLAAVYAQLGRLVRPGGVVVNADNIPYPEGRPVLQRAAERARERDLADAVANGGEDWEAWWAALGAEPGMDALVAERARRFAGIARDWPEPSVDVHVRALYDAGFGEVDTVWQHLDDRVLVAVR